MTTFSSISKEVCFKAFYTRGETIAEFDKRTGVKGEDKFCDGLMWYRSIRSFKTPEEATGYIIGRQSVKGSCWDEAAKTRIAKVTKVVAEFIDTVDQRTGKEVR